MTALTSPLLAPPRLSPTVLGVSGVAKFSPHDTYSTSSVPMSSMPSSSYSSPCSEKMRRAGEVSSSFTVASSSSSAIEAGRTAFLPTMAPTRRSVMRVGISARAVRAKRDARALLAATRALEGHFQPTTSSTTRVGGLTLRVPTYERNLDPYPRPAQRAARHRSIYRACFPARRSCQRSARAATQTARPSRRRRRIHGEARRTRR